MLKRKVKILMITISILLSLIFLLVILASFIFKPIFQTKDIRIEVKGEFMPVAYKGIIQGELVYFIFDKNQEKLFLFRQDVLIIRPNEKVVLRGVFGSVKTILGIKLWVRDSVFGLRIDDAMKVGEKRPVWGNNTVSFKLRGDEFKVFLSRL